MAEFDDNFRVTPGSSGISANHLELGLEHIGADQAGYVIGFDSVSDGFFDERPRRSDLTEQPLCHAEVDPRDRTDITTEAEPGLAIALKIVSAQRLN